MLGTTHRSGDLQRVLTGSISVIRLDAWDEYPYRNRVPKSETLAIGSHQLFSNMENMS